MISLGAAPGLPAASVGLMSDLEGHGGGLAYDVSGSGPPLILVHGLASSRRAWDLIAPGLSHDFTVYAVDLPGHGDSTPLPGVDVATPAVMARVLGGFMKAQGIERAHLVGNSLGGWTVLEAAADGRARSVVALCPAGLWDPIHQPNSTIDFNRRAARLTRPAIPLIMRIPPVRRTLMRAGAERADAVPYRVAVEAGLAQANATGFHAAHEGLLHHRFERSREIDQSVPVTVVFGDNDRLLPGPAFQRRDLVPQHSRWEVAWNCGHAPMWDIPALTSRYIRDAARAAG